MIKRQLGQVRPSGTSAVSLFAPGVSKPYQVELINISNVSSAAVNVSLFHDIDGTTYNQTTALIYQHTLEVGEVVQIDGLIADYLAAGNLGCQSSVADAATFTVYGYIDGERL